MGEMEQTNCSPLISIIVCSTHPVLDEALKRNIRDTIGKGFCYEIVCVDNSNSFYSIFSAYNEGVKHSKGEFLCFMHEDIIFHSEGWGEKVLKAFKNGQVGMLGVVGTAYVSPYHRGWFDSAPQSKYGKVKQGVTVNGKYSSEWVKWNKAESENVNVAAVDGLWFCVKRNLFDRHLIEFDERTFSGYHFYDWDICMQVTGAHYSIRIVDIDIEHKSLGNLNEHFYDDCLAFHSKWNGKLPLCADMKRTAYYKRYEDIFAIQVRCNMEREYGKNMGMFFHKVATKLYLLLGRSAKIWRR